VGAAAELVVELPDRKSVVLGGVGEVLVVGVGFGVVLVVVGPLVGD
jgi:hypothetical protein